MDFFPCWKFEDGKEEINKLYSSFRREAFKVTLAIWVDGEGMSSLLEWFLGFSLWGIDLVDCPIKIFAIGHPPIKVA